MRPLKCRVAQAVGQLKRIINPVPAGLAFTKPDQVGFSAWRAFCFPHGMVPRCSATPTRLGRLVFSHNLHRTRWQRVEKSLPVFLGEHAVVQHHHDAVVTLGTDEPTDALTKFEDRFR